MYALALQPCLALRVFAMHAAAIAAADACTQLLLLLLLLLLQECI
jgi:hypothetical protein